MIATSVPQLDIRLGIAIANIQVVGLKLQDPGLHPSVINHTTKYYIARYT